MEHEEICRKIASGFPEMFDEAIFDVSLTNGEFGVFERGIFSSQMEEKWNVFVLDETIFFARSWTDFVTYKVFIKRMVDHVLLEKIQVSRDESQYSGTNMEYDIRTLKELIVFFLRDYRTF